MQGEMVTGKLSSFFFLLDVKPFGVTNLKITFDSMALRSQRSDDIIPRVLYNKSIHNHNSSWCPESYNFIFFSGEPLMGPDEQACNTLVTSEGQLRQK